jgi:AbrB family looped-hinge helix DNA binding protein
MTPVEWFPVTLGERGRLVLPARLRKRLNLHQGDRVLLSLDANGAVRLVSAREVARRSRGMFADLAPERSLVDELIAERHAEAAKEDAE